MADERFEGRGAGGNDGEIELKTGVVCVSDWLSSQKGGVGVTYKPQNCTLWLLV